MKTIAQRHAEWERNVMPQGVGAMQRREMKRAFYSGFHQALVAGLEMADQSGANDDVGVTMIQRLHEECEGFVRDVLAGRA